LDISHAGKVCLTQQLIVSAVLLIGGEHDSSFFWGTHVYFKFYDPFAKQRYFFTYLNLCGEHNYTFLD
jgi:hypothetical protein